MFRPTLTRITSTTTRPLLSRAYSRITIVGRTGTAPELTTLPSGTPVIRYVVASDQSLRTQNEDGSLGNPRTNWFKITASANGMSDAQKQRILNIPTGTQVLVEGEPRLSTYPIEGGEKTASAFNVIQRQLEILRRPQGAAQSSDGAEAESAAA